MPPFNMFKAFSGSRNRAHRGDPTIYNEYPQGYPQGYPPAEEFQQEPVVRSQPRVLRRSSIKRREPLFTPLPSRTPTDAEDFSEGYIQVDSPDAVLGGALNTRPGKLDPPLPLLESPALESLSEREHRERTDRLHDVPRLLDRPPPLQHAGSFHGGRGERVGPDGPIVVTPSPSRSSASASDHTVEALHTPPPVHPNERVIPPLPRNYTGGYVPGSRSPTDIYGSYPYEVVHDAHSPPNREIYLDRYGRSRGYAKDSPIYYVIPGGMNVIFQDEHGNEITRVGDFSGRSRPLRPGPFVVQDEHGRELYRYDNHDRGSQRGRSESQIVQIDTYPSSGYHRRDRRYSSHGYRSDPSYRRGYDYYPDRREYRDYRERDGRDYRDHQRRGYADYPDHNDYRDHKGYRDYGSHRDRGGYREQGEYRREQGEYRHHGRPEEHVPTRPSSRASHRSHTGHVGQLSLERLPQQYPPISDDRRSGRDYAASHASIQQEEADISNGLQALHI